MAGELLSRRKLWTMSCESLFQILAASLSRTALEACCRKHHLPLPPQGAGEVQLYHLAHAQCHKDSPFSRHLQRYLERQHAAIATRLATSSPEHVHRQVEALFATGNPTLPADIAGFIWAVASDPRPAMRPVEETLIEGLHLLSHCLLFALFRGEVTGQGEPDSKEGLAALRQEVKRLEAERQALLAAYTRLERQRTRLVQENERLQAQLHALTTRCQALQRRLEAEPPPAAGSGAARRALKKLHYQVERLTARGQEQEREMQRLQGLVTAYEAMLVGHGTGQEAAVRPLSSPPEVQPRALQGRRVALIGGWGGATPHYVQAVQDLGGICLLHNGDLNQGRKRLAEVIKQADLVFCAVDCNSHQAVIAAKKLCKSLRKPCYFLHSSGVSQLREQLSAVASRLDPDVG